MPDAESAIMQQFVGMSSDLAAQQQLIHENNNMKQEYSNIAAEMGIPVAEVRAAAAMMRQPEERFATPDAIAPAFEEDLERARAENLLERFQSVDREESRRSEAASSARDMLAEVDSPQTRLLRNIGEQIRASVQMTQNNFQQNIDNRTMVHNFLTNNNTMNVLNMSSLEQRNYFQQNNAAFVAAVSQGETQQNLYERLRRSGAAPEAAAVGAIRDAQEDRDPPPSQAIVPALPEGRAREKQLQKLRKRIERSTSESDSPEEYLDIDPEITRVYFNRFKDMLKGDLQEEYQSAGLGRPSSKLSRYQLIKAIARQQFPNIEIPRSLKTRASRHASRSPR